jgi:general secretion pathway protein D
MVSELLETQGADQTQKINVIGDPRSNSIIIRAGSPERTELARNLIYKLDNAQSNPSNMHGVPAQRPGDQAGAVARGLLTGESDAGVSDEARGKLSAMGGNSKTGQAPAVREQRRHIHRSGAQSGWGKPAVPVAAPAAAAPPASRTPPSAPAA